MVIGIKIGNTTKAYKLQDLRSVSRIKDKVGATEITLRFDDETDTLTATDQSGNTLDHLLLYWFVWKEVHPEAEVYRSK